MSKGFSGNKDVDRQILSLLGDKELFDTMLINKYVYSLIDENFWRNRLMEKYPTSAQYKKGSQSWKNYYLFVTSYVDKLKRDFDFNYTYGDPKYVYDWLQFRVDKNMLGLGSQREKNFLKEGYDDLVLYLRNLRFLDKISKGSEEWEKYKKFILNK